MADRPELDARVQLVLDGLRRGKTREQIAFEIGPINRESLDQSMKRRGYVWNEFHETYVQDSKKEGNDAFAVDPLVEAVITQHRPITANPSEIAKRLRFDSVKHMGEFMASQGFRYDAKKHNYVKSTAQNGQKTTRIHEPGTDSLPQTDVAALLREIRELKRMLANEGVNDDLAVRLLPRVTRDGKKTSKCFTISISTCKELKQFCKLNSVSQSEFIEIAALELLRKLGVKRDG